MEGDIDKKTEIIEENNYYPFGLKHRGYNEIVNSEREHKFRFNDTEFDDDFDLNWYNMSLRHQDPTTGRWNGIDPVTHFSSSTYAGYNNNPVFWADPSGAWGDPVPVNGSTVNTGGASGGGILGFAASWVIGQGVKAAQNAMKTDFNLKTDFKNKQTNEIITINDGNNQVLEIDNKYWGSVKQVADVFNGDPTITRGDSEDLDELIRQGDWFFTIEDVLKGKEFIPYDNNCYTASFCQNIIGGGVPSDRTGQINLWVDNVLQLEQGKPALDEADPFIFFRIVTLSLINGNPVQVEANHFGFIVENHNRLTNHFINISGQGKDSRGLYYSYWDNGEWNKSLATDATKNRFYIRLFLKNGKIHHALIDSLDRNNNLLRITELRPNNK